MNNALWFFIGLVMGIAANFFLVLFMTRNLKDRIARLEKNEKAYIMTVLDHFKDGNPISKNISKASTASLRDVPYKN